MRDSQAPGELGGRRRRQPEVRLPEFPLRVVDRRPERCPPQFPVAPDDQVKPAGAPGAEARRGRVSPAGRRLADQHPVPAVELGQAGDEGFL